MSLHGIINTTTAAIVTSTIAVTTSQNRIQPAVTGSSLFQYGGNSTQQDNSGLNSSLICVPEKNYFTIAFQILVFPSLVFNLLMFVAAMMDSAKLQRQNYLFASVSSTLLSNILYMIFFEWILLDNYFEKTLHVNLTGNMTAEKYVWVFQESATVAMPFLICGNIVCLTYVTVSSATYVGRVANTEDTEKAGRRFQKVKQVTLALIVTSWAVPFLLTILGIAKMNCVLYCRCPSTNFEGDLCPGQSSCSTFWAPVTKIYLWVNVLLWFIALTALSILVIYGVIKYQRTMRRKQGSSVHTTSQPINAAEDTREHELPHNNNQISASQLNTTNAKTNLKRKNTRPALRHRLNSRLRFALTLTILFLACSTCFIVAIALDTALPNMSPTFIFALSRISMYIYTTLCPGVMVKYLPVLKTSLGNLFHKMKNSCKRN